MDLKYTENEISRSGQFSGQLDTDMAFQNPENLIYRSKKKLIKNK